MSERTIKTSKVGFTWLAYYVDRPGMIGHGRYEVEAINDLQNRDAEDKEDAAGERPA